MAIRILKFWTVYPKRDGVHVEVDMVEYCAPGRAQLATTIAPVKQLARVPETFDEQNIAAKMAHDRWNLIRPAYEAWKAGREIPANGTPLAAWPGVTTEQADVIRSFGLRSVEDVAEAPDSVIGRVQLPGMRNMQEQARAFLAAKDQNKVAEAIAAKDGEINDLKDQLEELRQLVIAQSQAKDADDDEPKRRGRPPKRDSPVNEEAAA